jgi:hypothetical protein
MFPSDIARWALGGRDPEQTGNNANQPASSSSAPLSEEDIRARRMARLAAIENSSTVEAMEIDDAAAVKQQDDTTNSTEIKDTRDTTDNASTTNQSNNFTLSEPAPKKQATKPQLTPQEKVLRKKNQILHRVLLLSLNQEGHGLNLHLTLDPNATPPGNWNASHIAEILANRLSYDKMDSRLDMARGGGGNDLIMYLCGCYRRAWGEWGERRGKGKSDGEEELGEILVEMRSQVSIDGCCFLVCVLSW